MYGNLFNKTTGTFQHSGFALPTVLITSVIMLAALASALQITVAMSTNLQYRQFNKLAIEAAESGLAMASACLDQSELAVTWSDSQPLASHTNCTGTPVTSCPITLRDSRCGVVENSNIRTTFEAKAPVTNGRVQEITVVGRTYQLRKNGSEVWRTYEYTLHRAIIQELDTSGNRASQRWWYFGAAAGLDFGTSGNTATPISAPCGGSCTAAEGITVATDTVGNLLFWTNGLSIWNRNHQIMQNSSGLNANNSTTQAAAFFPLGRTGTKYAVVTNNAVHANENEGELYYSVIDMSLASGNGAVTTKNQALWPGTTDYTSEALTAAPKPDGTGYWVITFRPGSGNLLVFEFDANGLVAGSAHEYPLGTSITRSNNHIGYGTLNFSRDYRKLVVMLGNHCTGTTACSNERGLVRLIDFDIAIGQPTLRFQWNNATTQLGGSGYLNQGYSADFSPNENYIYTSVLYPGRLYRYKIADATTSTQVKNSEEYIAHTNHAGTTNVYEGSGQVRRGPNGRMYVANYNHNAISVVNNPDAATTTSMTNAQRQAAVGWSYNGQALAGGTSSRYGLPQMATRYKAKIVVY